MRLAEDRFYNQYPCVIISGKGQPDVATRLFLNKARAIASTLQPKQALYSHSKHSTTTASGPTSPLASSSTLTMATLTAPLPTMAGARHA